MGVKNLIRRNLIRYAIGVGVVGAWAFASESSVAAVPECDCEVYNFPNPGDGPIPGVLYVEEEQHICELDPCES